LTIKNRYDKLHKLSQGGSKKEKISLKIYLTIYNEYVNILFLSQTTVDKKKKLTVDIT